MENFLKYSGIYLAKHFAYEGGIWITMESVRSGLEEAACSTAADEKYTCNRGGGGNYGMSTSGIHLCYLPCT